jgi:hypothetical protein
MGDSLLVYRKKKKEVYFIIRLYKCNKETYITREGVILI